MRTPLPDSYWVVEGKLLAGEYPGALFDEAARQKLDRLIQAGIRAFIDLTQPGELQPYESILKQLAYEYDRQIGYHRFAIGDFGIPTRKQMVRILDRIDLELAGGGAVYVHCRGGIGRTGTVVGCHLVRHELGGEMALQEIMRLRQGMPDQFTRSPESDEQCEFVLNWKEPLPSQNR